ncbi:MAG: hypothetical protein FWC70_06785 [Defluviitaleaceae bacterium]|nr:hypothetical protein [Defluviitaleaceae bacterium]
MKCRHRCRQHSLGTVLFFIGVGMFIQFLMPWWGFLLASVLVVLGFWFAYAR